MSSSKTLKQVVADLRGAGHMQAASDLAAMEPIWLASCAGAIEDAERAGFERGLEENAKHWPVLRWQEEIYSLAQSKGWWSSGPHDPEKIPEKLALIHSEVSEALEAYRSNNGGHELQVIWHKDGKPDGFAVELADVVIRCLDLAEAYGVNLDEAMKIKHNYNKTRSYKHGGKKC